MAPPRFWFMQYTNHTATTVQFAIIFFFGNEVNTIQWVCHILCDMKFEFTIYLYWNGTVLDDIDNIRLKWAVSRGGQGFFLYRLKVVSLRRQSIYLFGYWPHRYASIVLFPCYNIRFYSWAKFINVLSFQLWIQLTWADDRVALILMRI